MDCDKIMDSLILNPFPTGHKYCVGLIVHRKELAPVGKRRRLSYLFGLLADAERTGERAQCTAESGNAVDVTGVSLKPGRTPALRLARVCDLRQACFYCDALRLGSISPSRRPLAHSTLSMSDSAGRKARHVSRSCDVCRRRYVLA